MKETVKRCRSLRKNQTNAEKKLWYVLRDRQLDGIKLRRQYSIDKYIVDFYCSEYKLAIEADGGQHYDDKNIEKDAIRTRTINKYGIKVLRFSDIDILCNINAVCESILIEAKNKRS